MAGEMVLFVPLIHQTEFHSEIDYFTVSFYPVAFLFHTNYNSLKNSILLISRRPLDRKKTTIPLVFHRS